MSNQMPDLSSLGDLAKQMQSAYGDGLSAIGDVNKNVAENMTPTHQINIDVSLSAKVEGHKYSFKGLLVFEIDLDSILSSEGGDLSGLLDGLGVDLGDDKDAVMEQLGKPRTVGLLKTSDVQIELSNTEGKIKADVNKEGQLLATLDEGKLKFNFESAVSFPDHTDALYAVPSMEMMEKHVVVDIDKLDKKVSFSWTEKDKDNLEVKGAIFISSLA
jgi:hypothetical protein